MSTRLDELRQYTSNLSTRHEEVKQAAQAAKNQQSAAVASRLDNPINSPSVTKTINTQSAQIADRLNSGTYAANAGRQAAIVQQAKDYKSAQAAANLDNSLMGQATRDENIRRLNSAMEGLYARMEGYRNNGQTEELARSERQYQLLGDRLAENKAAGGSLEDASKWEQRQYDRIIQAGGEELMEQLSQLASLKATVDQENQANQFSEILKAPSKAWYEYQQRTAALREQYGDEAADWLAYAERVQNASDSQALNQKLQQAGKDMPVLTSGLSVGTNLISGLGTLDVAAQRLGKAITGSDIPIDYNRAAQRPAQVTSNIRQGVSEDLGGVGRFLYNTGMSMLDSASVMASGGAGVALLGGAAATSAMQEAIQRGATDDQALMTGLVAGGMEAVMEKASIDSLFNLKSAKNAKDVVLNILKQSGAEGTEEALTTIANTIADAIIMGDESQLETRKRELEAQGYSEQQAERTAMKEWGQGLALDAAGGALSGGVFGSVKTGVDSIMPKLQQSRQAAGEEQVAKMVQDLTGQNKNAPVNETETESTAVNTNMEKADGGMQAPNANEANPAMGAADSGFDPYTHASIEHGAIEPGENPARVVDVPKSMDGKSKVMQTVRTIMEADATPDAAIPELENAVVKGKFSRMPITDQAAADQAEAQIRRVGYQQALADWRVEVRSGMVGKNSVAVGEALYNAAVNAGDMKSAVKIAVDLSNQVRSAAQALQAVRMLKKMSPSAQLYGIKQSVDNLQKTLTDRYGYRAPNLTINENLAAQFLQAKTDDARTAAEEALYKDIARQIPATFADKWNAWRYLSMLGNPRTHIRNILGNAMFAPVRFTKNKLGAAMEAGAQAVGLIDKRQRTKALGAAGKELMDAARADYNNVESKILSGDKYNSASNIIDQNRRIYKFTALETLRKGNSRLLELEDSFFTKQAYASSLASYLKAQGYTAADFTGKGMTRAQKDAARSYAILEAQKATYRDLNALSELVTSIGFRSPNNSKTKGGAAAKKLTNAVLEGVLPFKKTPANILARAMEYSPAGLAKALVVDSVQVARGKITAAEYMDHLASGLTGSGLFALGYFLSNAGILVGSPEDKEQADLEGRQPYALEIGDTSITMDWLAPEAMPVFMGVELAEALAERSGEAVSMETIKSFFRGITGPVLEMSMMSGLQDALDAVSYADDKMTAVAANAALGYLSQALPTLFGQIERTFEKNAGIRQTTFTQEGRFLDKDTQYALGNLMNKFIFDYSQVPYIDAWGKTEETGEAGTRLFNNMLNPAYVSTIQETAVDREIKRLEEALGENLTPARAEKILTINKEKVILTADEYVTYAQAKGQNDLAFRQKLIDSDVYQGLDDKTKAKAMEYSRELANVLAMQEAGFEPDLSDWQAELTGADVDTITNALVTKAVESQAGLSEGGKCEGIGDMLESGVIDEQLALSLLPESTLDSYLQYGKKSGVPVSDLMDVISYKNSAESAGIKDKNGKDIKGETRQDHVREYIAGLDLTRTQKRGLWCSIYAESTCPW